jgi:hypothetical protein
MTIFDWIPQVVVGLSFITLACLKFYGLYRGIEGGAKRPFAQRLCGT